MMTMCSAQSLIQVLLFRNSLVESNAMILLMQSVLIALLGCQVGQQQNEYALLLALVTLAVLVVLLVLGPQTSIVYAHANMSGGH